MSKKIITLVLVLSLLLSLVPATGTMAENLAGGEVLIYVAPNGNDKATGTINDPLKTFQGAKHRVRSVAGTRPVRVIFREGQYNVDKTQVFGTEDSGRYGAFITYESYPGEKVVISGAKRFNPQDFVPVTNEEMLMRFDVKARDHVLQLDMKKYGIHDLIDTKEFIEGDISSGGDIHYGLFLLDNNEQMLAQWPNGEGAYDIMGKVYLVGNTANRLKISKADAACVGYTNDRVENWEKSEGEAFFQFFSNNDYRGELLALIDVDTAEKKIYVSSGTQPFSASRNKARYKIFNCPEELDVPTEYYIDRENKILYYYPPSNFNENSIVEFTANQGNLINMEHASFIRFKGLQIMNATVHLFQLDSYCHDLDFVECVFSNAGHTAVMCRSADYSAMNPYVPNAWTSALITGAYNINLNKNIIMNTGKLAFSIYGKELMPHGNYLNIQDNYVTRIGLTNVSGYGLQAFAYGANISNNLIHSINNGGILLKTSESLISYNEIYDACRLISDCGGIYQGMLYSLMNMEICYNMVYNINGRFDAHYKGYSGIYMDDCGSGGYMHHNMVANQKSGLVHNGGKNLRYISNHIVVEGSPISIHARGEDPTWNDYVNRNKMDENFIQAKEIPEIIKLYPNFQDIADGYIRAPYATVMVDNISNKDIREHLASNKRGADFDRVAELGTVENNSSTPDASIYVDFEHMDMRLKMGTELQKKHPNNLNEENFDINKIGITWDPKEKLDTSFVKYYPADGAVNVDNSECTFFWSPAIMADKYRIQVATDENFTDLIIDDETYYNNYTTDMLNSEETKYFWRVSAINERRYYETAWDAKDGVGSFTTVAVDGNDVQSLERAIKNAKAKADQIVDGVNYTEGTKQKALGAIAKAEKVLKEQAATASRSKIQSTIYELDYALKKCVDNLILKFVSPTEWFSSEKPYFDEVYPGRTVNFVANETDGIIFETDNSEGGTNGFGSKEHHDRDSIFCFQMKINTNNSWGGFSLRHNVKDIGYMGNCYTIVVKNERIELQRTGGTGYMAAAVNDGIIESGKWHDVAFGCVNSILGTRVIFIVDGRYVFDMIDSESTISDTGYFSVFTGARGYNMYFKPAKTIYEFAPVEKSKEVDITEVGLTSTGAGFETDYLTGHEFVNANVTVGNSGKIVLAENGSDNYTIDIDEKYVSLTKNSDGNSKVISKVENTKLQSGAHDIRVGVLSVNNNNRVVLTSDGITVIDSYDISPINPEGKMKFNFASVSAGNKVAHIIDIDAVNPHDGVIQHTRHKNDVITDTSKSFTIKADFPRSRYYIKRGLSPNGDKNVTVNVMYDSDLGQTGEESYATYTIDLTKGDDGWFCIGYGAYPEVKVEVISSGSGEFLIGDYTGFGTTDSSTIEVNNFQTKYKDLFIAKADRDIMITNTGNVKLSANVDVIDRTYFFPIDVANALGITATVDGNNITLTKGNNVANLTVGSNKYTLNGAEFEQRTANYIAANGSVMVNIDVLAEVMGSKTYKHFYGVVLITPDITKTFKLTSLEADNLIKKFY